MHEIYCPGQWITLIVEYYQGKRAFAFTVLHRLATTAIEPALLLNLYRNYYSNYSVVNKR